MNDSEKQAIFMRTTFVPLQNISPDKSIQGTASGTWVKYNGRSLLLTVHHAVSKPGHWAMEVKVDPINRQTEFYSLPEPYFFKLVHRQSGVERILDFAVFELPDNIFPVYSHNDTNGNFVDAFPRIQYDLNFEESVPNSNEEFIFSGRTRREDHRTIRAYAFTCPIRIVRFSKVLEDNAYVLEFDLEKPFNDHNEFRGCSGSPVVGCQSGNLVSLITHGNQDRNKIYGVRLELFRQQLKDLFLPK